MSSLVGSCFFARGPNIWVQLELARRPRPRAAGGPRGPAAARRAPGARCAAARARPAPAGPAPARRAQCLMTRQIISHTRRATQSHCRRPGPPPTMIISARRDARPQFKCRFLARIHYHFVTFEKPA